jgi:hypothetical protein
LSRFSASVIDDIQRSNFARIELLVLHQTPATVAPPVRSSKLRALWNNLKDPKLREKLGYTLYQKFDERFFSITPDPQELVDCSETLAGIDVLPVIPIAKGFVHRFQPDDVARVRQYDLDVILRFGFNIIKGEILNSAKHGIWSFHHGDNEFYRGGPALFWEIVERNPLSGVILQVLTEELDGGHVLAKALFSTRQGVSVRLNRYTPYWGAVTMAIQKLYELHSFGWEYVQRRAVPNLTYRGQRKLYRTPTNKEIAVWFFWNMAAKVAGRISRGFRGSREWQWRIAVRQQPKPLSPVEGKTIDGSFRWLDPPPGHFHADPFLLERDGKTWMFYEDYVYAYGRAAICCRELRRDGSLGPEHSVLNCPYHLSYPFVFEDGNEVYMIPESEKNGTVDLFRATKFPFEWKLEKTLLHIRAVDSTLLIRSDGYWLFTAVRAPYGDGSSLCLYHSDSLTGEWQPHPANPLSRDVREARPAGRFVRRDGRLYRLSQDCSGRYGSSFSFREVLALSKTEYREALTAAVLPSGTNSGVHTYDVCGHLEVIDGVTQIRESHLRVPADFPPIALPGS